MENLLLKAIMVSIFMWITFFDKYVTQFFTYRPIVVGPIVGAIMGDINIGLQVGCTIELMFLGQVFVGTALPQKRPSQLVLLPHSHVYPVISSLHLRRHYH